MRKMDNEILNIIFDHTKYRNRNNEYYFNIKPVNQIKKKLKDFPGNVI
jgi:hypothetical protein